MTDLIERGHELLAEGKVTRALACLGKAGERGCIELAKCYRDGVGVKVNQVLAKKYFWLAVRQAKRVHEMEIRALRNRPRNRLSRGRREKRRYAVVRNLLIAA